MSKEIGSNVFFTSKHENYYANTALKPYLREKQLDIDKIKIVLAIFSPRDIKFIEILYSQIDFVDKVWFKHFSSDEARQDKLPQFLKNHPNYDYVAITSDDLYLNPQSLLYLVTDLSIWDLPIISGCCNQCNTLLQIDNICSDCRDQLPHQYINVTFDPVLVDWQSLKTPSYDVYNFISNEWREKHPIIKRVWYQGFAPVIIKKEIMNVIPFRSTNIYGQDLGFALDCEKMGIPQFCDFRAYSQHWGLFRRDVIKDVGGRLVTTKEPRVIFEPKKNGVKIFGSV